MKIGKRKIDETLFELLVGIILFAAVCQAALVWFMADKAGYSGGLWIGALMAASAAAHMYRSLDAALEPGNLNAEKMIRKNSVVRYLVIVVIFAVIMVTDAVNPLSAFLGLMGLKVSAYMQPFTHKWITGRICKKDENCNS